MMLLLSIVGFARAQQALPYEYGFEDNALTTDGWVLQGASSASTGINTAAKHDGSYGFRFTYSEQSAYLLSPILTGGDNGVDVSFWYKEYSSQYGDEQFQVGYTTDDRVTDASEFTYGDVVTASTDWQQYSNSFPAGTKRIAIKYIYNDCWYLYLDDFSFEAGSPYIMPANLSVANIGETTATVSWEAPSTEVTGYKYQYMPAGGSWTTLTNTTDLSVDLSGLNSATTYTFQVQAIYSGGESKFASITFTTDCPESLAIPYAYGFEDVNAIGCWTLSAPNNTFIDDQDPSFARSGNNFFFFNYTTEPPQYLISPKLSGIVNGLHVEFYYSQYTNGVETFQVGYSTTDNNPANFTWGNEITASTSYQRFSANYPADTKYVAVKHTSDDQYYLFIDDFLFEESASVLEPTDVHVSNATTTSADISWTAGASETAWDIYVTDDETDVPVETTTPTVVNTSDNPYSLTGLTPATYYYVYVRANTGTETSAWSSPVKFNTKANPITLPYSYDFENDELPIGWSTIITNTSYTNASVMTPSSSSSNRVLAFYMGSSTGTLAAVLPEVDAAYPLKGYQISFDACYANASGGSMTSGKLGIGIMTDPEDFTTFELIEEVDITDGFSTYGSHTVWLNGYTGTGQYIAIKNIYTQNGYVLVDNVAVTELPAVLPPTNVVVTGGKNAVVTWEGSAESYDVAFSTDGTSNPDDVIVASAITVKEFNLSTYTVLGDNFVWVRSNSGSDHSSWVAISFNVGYCSPNATSHDGKGIIGVAFGTGTDVVDYSDTNGIPSSAPYYGDYTSEVGAIPAGVESTIAITTNTGSYPYTFVIWVDLDNSLSFEDNEILYVGKASSGSGTLNATITIPATQALGDYRMRIYGADSYFTQFYNGGTPDFTKPHDPCADGTYRHVCDFTVRVTEAPACLAPTGLSVANITTNSAELSWTANSGETKWTVYYKKVSETDYTEVPNVTENPYTLTGLAASTDYVFYVVAHVGTDTSNPSNTCNFTTDCDVFIVDAANSFFEGFEGTDFAPSCWTNISTVVNGSTKQWTKKTTQKHSGSASASSGWYGDIYLKLPAMQIDGDAVLSFWSYYSYASDYDKSSVVLFDGSNEIELWTPDASEVTSKWVKTNIDLSAYDGQTISLAFKYEGDNAHEWFVDDVQIAVPANIILTNAGTDNAATIATNDRALANVTLSGRTLYKDGSWNTICLPFELTLVGSPLDGATAKTLTDAVVSGTTITLTFGDAVTSLEAGKPYLIKWDKDDVNPTITDPVFPYVNIDATTDHTISPISDVKFIGYYDAFGITAADTDIYYMTGNNELKHTGVDRTLKACRAYFQFDDGNPARTFVLNFGDDDVPTTISNLSEEMFGEGDWYTPSGIKVGDSIPVKKGVYINNGKKVVVK